MRAPAEQITVLVDASYEFPFDVKTIIVDNLTDCYLYSPDAQRFIQPNIAGLVLPIHPIQTPRLQWLAPPGKTQPTPASNAQQATVVFVDALFPPTSGSSVNVTSMNNPMTTVGDIIVAAANGSPNRLGIGAAGQVLEVVAGTPTWQTLPTFTLASGRGVRTAGDVTKIAGALSDMTDVTVTLATTRSNVMVTVSGLWSHDTPGSAMIMDLLVDGVAVKEIAAQVTNANYLRPFAITWLITGLAAGNHTFKLQINATGGGTLTVYGGTTANRFTSIEAVELAA